MERLHEFDAVSLSALLAERRMTAEDLMAATLDRIAAVNPGVNAIVSLGDPDALLAAARAADASPRQGWLHGIPIAVKDLSDAQGFPTSMGSPLAARGPARRDALFVARLRAAGAIVIGKTNTPEFGLGSHTFNPVFGATRNPWDRSRSAGGSSGGAAVALATGMLAVADGSDMMGSLRNPAGWNNVYGMRPTWGLVPGDPEGDSFLHQLGTAGPMARSPRDLAAMLATMAGPDPRLPHDAGAFCPAPEVADMAGVRVGWLGDWGGALPTEAGVLETCEAALRQLESLGAQVEPLAAPFSAPALWESWTTLRSWSVAASLSPLLADPRSDAGLKAEARWEIERGLRLSAMEVHRASVIRSDWFRTAAALFDRFDVLALPTAQTWPFPVEWHWPREIAGVAMDSYHRWMEVVVPASLIGLPVVAAPAGFGAAGLPMGLQLIGRRGADARLLEIAGAWHAGAPWTGRKAPAV